MVDYRRVRRLLNGIRCKGCGRRYGCGRVRTLDRRQEVWFLSTACARCQISRIFAVLPQEGRAIEVVLDLTEKEMAHWRERQPVTSDDALAVHLFLKDFQGDVRALLTTGS